MSCFAMTEPEVAGSDPTLIRTHAERDGDEWIINGHKWFISNARRSQFAILIARTEPDVPEGSSGATTAFIVDIPSEGWHDVREVETMHGATGHSEIVIEELRVRDEQILGGRGNGHRLGQTRLGPARLAHCMRWIAQAETALDMMVDRSIDPSLLTRIDPGRETGCPVDDRRFSNRALSVQAYGAAHGLQDRPR
jgi:acyl-CoA dehydrogenase